MELISKHRPAITGSLRNSCFTRSCFAGPTTSRLKSDTGPGFTRCLSYIRAYLRPDGFAPLIGDTDSGRVLPVGHRSADDHAYLLDIGAAVFNDPTLKPDAPQVRKHFRKPAFTSCATAIFISASMRATPEYNGRGSHGHNDALSIEVSAGGRAFIVDPGTYVYSADLQKRHEFRSTAYHSTVKIDDKEQNTIDPNYAVCDWQRSASRGCLSGRRCEDFDKIVAEHYGYAPVTHRRSVTFNKRERSWLIDDEFFGDGEHVYEVRFHFDSGLDVQRARNGR